MSLRTLLVVNACLAAAVSGAAERWAAKFLAQEQPRPFFLACGIVKPHTPWHVPAAYFELFPPDRITLPALAADETAGVPPAARDKLNANLRELGRRRNEAVAAYLAAMPFADDCVGRILEGLGAGPNRARTIVVVCGDNGYQFGEKNNWSKGGLWEGSANVPLVVAGPGVAAGQTSQRPVSLLDLYPTLVELAGLPAKADLDGTSIAALLKDPQAPWDRPALTTKGFKNHALRSEQWRYIHYADGSAELYDHKADPLERTNLAGKPDSAAVIAPPLAPPARRTAQPRPAAGHEPGELSVSRGSGGPGKVPEPRLTDIASFLPESRKKDLLTATSGVLLGFPGVGRTLLRSRDLLLGPVCG
jgi:arylsulfatase A-like enzyme